MNTSATVGTGVRRYGLGRERRLKVESDHDLNDYSIPVKFIECSSQHLAITSPADTTIYYGNRGAGKSLAMLMNFARDLDAGYGDYYIGMILAHIWEGLANVIIESERLFSDLPGARFLKSQQQAHWEFRGGEMLMFKYCSEVRDYSKKVHGKSIAWLGIEEATVWPDSSVIDKAMTTLRPGFSSKVHSVDPKKPIRPLKPRLFIVTNPSEVGRQWFKERYIDGRKLGRMYNREYEVPVRQGGKLLKVKRHKTEIVLFGSFIENPYYDPDARAYLMEACSKNESMRDQWIRGKWDAVVGGILEGIWDPTVHVIPRFAVPSSWYVDRSMDWGSHYPTAVVWWAESDGTEVLIDGKKRIFPKGTLFALAELYTSDSEHKGMGTKASVTSVCKMIKGIEQRLLDDGFIPAIPEPGPADRTIDRQLELESTSIKEKMEYYDIFWTLSDSSQGARINGMALLRQRVEAALGSESSSDYPGLYICHNCVNIIRTVPSLTRDEKKPEDINKQGNVEDHLYDAIRYRVLTDTLAPSVEVGFL